MSELVVEQETQHLSKFIDSERFKNINDQALRTQIKEKYEKLNNALCEHNSLLEAHTNAFATENESLQKLSNLLEENNALNKKINALLEADNHNHYRDFIALLMTFGMNLSMIAISARLSAMNPAIISGKAAAAIAISLYGSGMGAGMFCMIRREKKAQLKKADAVQDVESGEGEHYYHLIKYNENAALSLIAVNKFVTSKLNIPKNCNVEELPEYLDHTMEIVENSSKKMCHNLELIANDEIEEIEERISTGEKLSNRRRQDIKSIKPILSRSTFDLLNIAFCIPNIYGSATLFGVNNHAITTTYMIGVSTSVAILLNYLESRAVDMHVTDARKNGLSHSNRMNGFYIILTSSAIDGAFSLFYGSSAMDGVKPIIINTCIISAYLVAHKVIEGPQEIAIVA